MFVVVAQGYDLFVRTPSLCSRASTELLTLCSRLYSSSNAFCISKSSWRSRLIRCCSISRTTPSCIACDRKQSAHAITRYRFFPYKGLPRVAYLLLELLLEVNKENGATSEERGTQKGQLRSLRHSSCHSYCFWNESFSLSIYTSRKNWYRSRNLVSD